MSNISLLVLRPMLAVLPLRGRIRADFGLVRVSGKNPKQRPSRSPDTYQSGISARCPLLPRKKNNSPTTQRLFYILVASQNGSPRQATQQRASAHRSSQDIGASLPKRKGKMRKSTQNEMISTCPSLSKHSSRLLGTSRCWEIELPMVRVDRRVVVIPKKVI
jgi:hypothetical protein